MNEKTFKDFGEALDLLESVMGNSNKDCQKIIRESFDKLDSFYRQGIWLRPCSCSESFLLNFRFDSRCGQSQSGCY